MGSLKGDIASDESRRSAPAIQELGDFFYRNYTPREYRAFFQNWAVVQDGRGVIYAGNNSGVLEYDGARWRLIPTPKGTLIRSLAVDAQGRVYVGAVGDLGYLEPTPLGQTRFVSLLDKIPQGDRAFSDIWSLQVMGNSVFFQSFERLFCLSGNEFRVWKPKKSFERCYVAGDKLLIRDESEGLGFLDGQALVFPSAWKSLAASRLRGGLPGKSPGTYLLATLEGGLHLADSRSVHPFLTEVDRNLRREQINCLSRFGDGSLAVGTHQGGLYQLSWEGKVLGRFTQKGGLQNESIKQMDLDAQSGLWLALQKGLTRVEGHRSLTRFDEGRGLLGTTMAIHRHQGCLYVGTDQGLFRLEKDGRFSQLPGTKRAVWSFVSWGDRLLIGTASGLWELRNGQLKCIWNSPMVVYSLLRSKKHPERLFLGLQTGLASVVCEGEQWRDEGQISKLLMAVRSLHETPEGDLWLGSSTRGVARIRFDAARRPQVEHFGREHGLPSLNHTYVHFLAGEMLVSSHFGIFRWTGKAFEAHPAFARLFRGASRWLYALEEDPQGRIWMHSCDEALGWNEPGCAVPQADGQYRWDATPSSRISGGWIETIQPEAGGVVWFGGSEGLFRLDTTQPRNYQQSFKTLLRGVTVGEGRRITELPLILNYSENRLRFEFAATSLDLESANRYQVWLEGYEKGWSPWTPEVQADYTNLPEGTYHFRVRAKNLYGTIGAEDSLSFRILPPLYRTWWAYLLYTLSAILGGWSLIRWRMAALRAHNLELETKVQERTRDLAARNAELLALDATVQAINREVELQPLLEAILHQSLQQFPQAQRGAVFIQDEGDGLYRVRASLGYPPGTLDTYAFTEEEISHRYTHGTEHLDEGVFHVRQLSPVVGSTQIESQVLPQSLLAMSLAFEGRLAGFLLLENFSSLDAFQEADAEKLLRFREHTVTALGKARLFDRLQVATQKLKEASDQKNQFLGIVAHDLRNPLNSIVLAAQLLDGEEDLEEVARTARKIQKEGMDMSALIGRFLEIAAIESGEIRAELERLDLVAAANHIVQRHSSRAQEKQIHLELHGKVESIYAWADARFLKEVLDNLVSNALKFSPPGREVHVLVEPAGERSRITVTDQGPGLNAEDLKKLFGRFARLSARPTGGEKSTGLGLSIVKHMVDAMGGSISVISQEGQGSRFEIYLPRCLSLNE